MYKGINLLNLYPFFKGLKHYNNSDYKTAQKIWSTLVEKNSNNAYFNFKYGMCFYKQGKWDEALEYFKKAKATNQFLDQWEQQYITAKKNTQKSNKINTSSSKKAYLNKKDDVGSLLKYAETLYHNKTYWQAIRILEEFIDKNETKVKEKRIYFLLGLLYIKFKNFEAASLNFKQASKLDPNNMNYKYKYAYSLEEVGNVDDALHLYSEIVNNSSDELFECGEGDLHGKAGLWDKASAAYEKRIVDFHIREPLIFKKLAYAYGRQYLWDKAAINYENAIKFSSKPEASLYFKCGESHEKNGDLKKAAHFYQSAVDRSNDYIDYWYYRYAYVLQKLNEYKKANSIFANSRKRKLPYAIDPKSTVKDSTQALLSQYAEYYETLEIREDIILFESYFGNNISCCPYAILKQLLIDDNYNHFTFICIINKSTIIPSELLYNDRVICVKRGSDLYLRYLTTAKYLINNVTFPYYFIRKAGQFYLNTWHGTPIKTLGKDIKEPFFDHSNVARNFLQCTHIISPNRYTSNILLDKYDIRHMYAGKIAETGYPRVDLTLNVDRLTRQKLLNKLGLHEDLPIILYAPTWRGTSENKFFNLDKLKQDLQLLTSDKYQLIFKAHHLVKDLISKANIDVKLIPSDIDTNILLGCIDGLISDYSSIVFDFIKTGKPIFSYIADYDLYQQERGLYFEKDHLPGVLCEDIYKLKKNIIQTLLNKDYLNKEEIVRKFAPFDDGTSTQRVINFLFHNEQSHVYSFFKKNVYLFFAGPFIPNGITTSFINLLNNISKNEKINNSSALTVIINKDDLINDDKRISKLYDLPENINVLSRIGSIPMTIEEIWIRKKFEETFEIYSTQFMEHLSKIYEREIKRLFGDSHIHSVVNFEGYALFWCYLLGKINAKNKIIFQHNDLYQEWKTRFPYLEADFKSYFMYDKLVSVSEITCDINCDNLSELFNIPQEKFLFSSNTIQPNKIFEKSLVNNDINPLFDDFNGIKLVNIGRLSHEKDQEKLIRAFAKCVSETENVGLFIIGSGPLQETLTDLISELKLENKVFLLGQIENPYPYLKQSDLFLLSSNHEGQPMVLLEAMVLEKPIIATDIPANRYVLNNGKYGMLVENTEEGVLEGINLFIEKGIQFEKFDFDNYNNLAIESFINLLNL